jgi:hypothetical protein
MLKFAKYNKKELAIFFIWTLLWFGLGTHMSGTFNISNYYFPSFNFLRANLIFYIFLILLINFLYRKKKTEYLIFVLYPILGFIGFILNSNESIYFGLHNSISLLAIALFINFISYGTINKKLIFYLLHYSSIFILSVFFILFIAPDLINKILSLALSSRDDNTIDIIFSKNISFHIPQNSNGTSRIVFVITLLLMCFYNFYLKDRLTKLNIFLFLCVLSFASINIFYQSKLNILGFVISCLYIFLNNYNYKNKLKILSLILFVILPFLINYTYNKYHNENYDMFKNNRIFNEEEGFLSLKNFSISKLDYKNISKLDYKNYGELKNLCITHNSGIDIFLGGRVCGWELLTRQYFNNFKFFGNGFFEDRKILEPFQKISSNSYIFALYNAGILSFFILIIFYANISTKIIRCALISSETKDRFLATVEFYKILTAYLIVRSFFEDTLAFVSIDLLLMVTCISFFNYFFDNSKN